jgi:hypothetical protein
MRNALGAAIESCRALCWCRNEGGDRRALGRERRKPSGVALGWGTAMDTACAARGGGGAGPSLRGACAGPDGDGPVLRGPKSRERETGMLSRRPMPWARARLTGAGGGRGEGTALPTCVGWVRHLVSRCRRAPRVALSKPSRSPLLDHTNLRPSRCRQAEPLSFTIVDNLRRPLLNISYILREGTKTFTGYARCPARPAPAARGDAGWLGRTARRA